jgi:hypothetical protein
MTLITEGRKPQTKRIRFGHLTAFFNFIKNNFDSDLLWRSLVNGEKSRQIGLNTT